MNEFEIIEKFFTHRTTPRADVIVRVGDDAAILAVPDGYHLVTSTDTFLEGVDFLKETPAKYIGHKALAVNLSDLAAMGADPAWFMTALTLPAIDESWLEKFSQGLCELANTHGMQLVGGDLSRGPLSITIQVMGFLPKQQALTRHGAAIGDRIYVTGTLGDAGLGLEILFEKKNLPGKNKNFLLNRLHKPTPQIAAGQLLRTLASSAIDISDGLLADLTHILQKSDVGAIIFAEQLPLSPALQQSVSKEEACRFALTAGDDYELCFTVSPAKEAEIIARLNQAEIPNTCIGQIVKTAGIQIEGFSGKLSSYGFQHF